jgi:hypothetical protein
MILNFDSEKQRDYWIYVLIGIFAIVGILELIFGGENEKNKGWFSFFNFHFGFYRKIYFEIYNKNKVI